MSIIWKILAIIVNISCTYGSAGMRSREGRRTPSGKKLKYKNKKKLRETIKKKQSLLTIYGNSNCNPKSSSPAISNWRCWRSAGRWQIRNECPPGSKCGSRFCLNKMTSAQLKNI